MEVQDGGVRYGARINAAGDGHEQGGPRLQTRPPLSTGQIKVASHTNKAKPPTCVACSAGGPSASRGTAPLGPAGGTVLVLAILHRLRP